MWLRTVKAFVVGLVTTGTLLVVLIGGPVRDGSGPTTPAVPASEP